MSWSLKVSHGDLVLGSSSLATVTRDSKLVQDLRHWILERIGTDTLHPWYGSTLDDDENIISSWDWEIARIHIEAEIRRIVAQYQNQQVARAKSDRLRLNRSTLSAGEVCLAIESLSFVRDQDTLRVTINIAAGNDTNQILELSLPQTV